MNRRVGLCSTASATLNKDSPLSVTVIISQNPRAEARPLLGQGQLLHCVPTAVSKLSSRQRVSSAQTTNATVHASLHPHLGSQGASPRRPGPRHTLSLTGLVAGELDAHGWAGPVSAAKRAHTVPDRGGHSIETCWGCHGWISALGERWAMPLRTFPRPLTVAPTQQGPTQSSDLLLVSAVQPRRFGDEAGPLLSPSFCKRTPCPWKSARFRSRVL